MEFGEIIQSLVYKEYKDRTEVGDKNPFAWLSSCFREEKGILYFYISGCMWESRFIIPIEEPIIVEETIGNDAGNWANVEVSSSIR